MGREVSGHWKKLVSDPKYLGEADFKDGQEIAVTISSITEDVVTSTEGKSNKIVVHFKENCKPLVLNVTNSKAIVKVTKKKEVQDWKGHRILLYIDPKVKAFGEIVSAVRVRPYSPPASASKPMGDPIKCELCQADIKPFGKMTVEQVAAHTKNKYGKALCSDCATKAAESKVEENKKEDIAKSDELIGGEENEDN